MMRFFLQESNPMKLSKQQNDRCYVMRGGYKPLNIWRVLENGDVFRNWTQRSKTFLNTGFMTLERGVSELKVGQ